jgi:hypothetical protein
VFARYIAHKPKRHGQAIEVLQVKTANGLTAGADRTISRLIADPTVSAAVLLFPKIPSLKELAKGLIGLKDRPGWTVSFGALDHPSEGPLVTVALSRAVPFNGASIASEALVLGPYDLFPRTRRATVPAMEIYVGLPRASDPKTNEPTAKANLAHMTLGLPNAAYAMMWDRSGQGRLKSLGGVDDARAKAKVAFVLPIALATEIGAVP